MSVDHDPDFSAEPVERLRHSKGFWRRRNVNRAVAIGLGFATSALIALVIGAALLWSSVNRAQNEAQHVLWKAHDVFQDTARQLILLNGQDPTVCDSALLYRMRVALFQARYIKDIGFMSGGSLRCTTGIGQLEEPYDDGTPQFVADNGMEIFYQVPLVLFGEKRTASILRMAKFNGVLDPHALDYLAAEPYRYTLVMARDGLSQVWLSGVKQLDLPPNRNMAFSDQGVTVKECDHQYNLCAILNLGYANMVQEEFVPFLVLLFASVGGGTLVSVLARDHLRKRNGFKTRLQRGLSADRVELHYQPVVCLNTGALSGVEVLARWRDRNGRLRMPDRFIPILERDGLIWTLTTLVIRKAFQELNSLKVMDPSLQVAINVSALDLRHRRLASFLEGEVAPADRRRLVIEVTEGQVLDVKYAQEAFSTLQGMGVRIAIDDFGTGYANLANLKSLPVDVLKVDRSFVNDIEFQTIRSSLVPHMVEIARTIQADVVAEGIENAKQYSLLKGMAVTKGQGFHIARPMPVDALGEWLMARIHAVEAAD